MATKIDTIKLGTSEYEIDLKSTATPSVASLTTSTLTTSTLTVNGTSNLKDVNISGTVYSNNVKQRLFSYYEGATFGNCYSISSPNATAEGQGYSIQIGESGFTVDNGDPTLGASGYDNLLWVNHTQFQYQPRPIASISMPTITLGGYLNLNSNTSPSTSKFIFKSEGSDQSSIKETGIFLVIPCDQNNDGTHYLYNPISKGSNTYTMGQTRLYGLSVLCVRTVSSTVFWSVLGLTSSEYLASGHIPVNSSHSNLSLYLDLKYSYVIKISK